MKEEKLYEGVLKLYIAFLKKMEGFLMVLANKYQYDGHSTNLANIISKSASFIY